MAGRLAEEHDEVEFVGTPNGLESRLVPEAGVAFRSLQAAGFNRSRPWTLLTSTVLILVSAVRAWRWMGERRPDVVVGFGGYVSIPVGLAAVARGVPLVLLEQNSVPGLANRILSRWARSVGVTYEESAPLLRHPERVVLVGNPVRAAVLASTRAAGRHALGIDSEARLLLVFGGSRGARHINTALVGIRDRLMALDDLVVVQVTGPAEFESVGDLLNAAGGNADGRWRIVDYCEDMGGAIAASDVVLARAGATSIAEITALGAPAVLVPYPYATEDHQTRNAATMVLHGAARLVPDAELDGDLLGDELLALLEDASSRATMSAASKALGRPDAARRVVALCREAALRPENPRELSDSA